MTCFWDLFWGIALTGTKLGRRPQTSPETSHRALSKEGMGMGAADLNRCGHFGEHVLCNGSIKSHCPIFTVLKY